MNFKHYLEKIYRRPLIQASLVIFIITLIAALVVEFSEAPRNSQFGTFWDSVWWVIVTITTVGYGDKVPVTAAGRLTGVLIMFIGIATLSVVTASISSIFISRQMKEERGLQAIKLKNHILICGWSGRGEQVLTSLKQHNKSQPVVMINLLGEELNHHIAERFPELNLRFVHGDFTQETILERASAAQADAAVIIPDTSSGGLNPGDERTILAILSLRTLNHKMKIYAHVMERSNFSHARKAGADEVLVSDSLTGYLLANFITDPGVPQFIQQVLSVESGNSFQSLLVSAAMAGKTYREVQIQLLQDTNQVVLGLARMRQPFNLDEVLSGDSSYLDEFIRRKFQEAGRGRRSDAQLTVEINPPAKTPLTINDILIILTN